MNKYLKVCKILDDNQQYHLSDFVFNKFALSYTEILEKRILVPDAVKHIAKEAYDKRFGEIRFGTQHDYDMAREINLRIYLSLDDVLKIHQFTYERRYNHSKSDKNPTYWEYRLYGGEEGRKWASDIIRLYLPNKWKPA